jgi:hypothetical protein
MILVLQNTRVLGLWRLPPRFQRKAQEARPCMAESRSLRVMHEDVRVKLKLQW